LLDVTDYVDQLKVSNFQSIASADVTLDGFTVLEGPSNSGKSAFLRATRAVVRNVNNPSVVRQGTKSLSVEAVFGLQHVMVERGKSLSTYRMVAEDDGIEEMFTKSGTQVPTDVAEVLRMPLIAGTDANFSFQFDKPFLLSETGSTVAAVLGTLTNVALLYEAVREANRRRTEASSVLKVRDRDIATLTERLETFADLPEEYALLQEVSAQLEELQKDHMKLGWLSINIQNIETAHAALKALVEPKPVPDTSAEEAQAQELIESIAALNNLVSEHGKFSAALTNTEKHITDAKAALVTAEANYQEEAEKEPLCPTCGKPL
jgi:DNA repair ATPase RecN